MLLPPSGALAPSTKYLGVAQLLLLPSRVSTSKKILVVEDNEDCRELQACVIRRLGYLVIEADNGAAAIAEALAGHPDLILMDLNMPKMNGEEATEQLKNQPSTRDIPVIICTAYGPGPRVDRALDAGAVEILHKPFKFSELEILLRKHVPDDPKNEAEGGHPSSAANCTETSQFPFQAR
jgi:CheY-like chemotaxis protein